MSHWLLRRVTQDDPSLTELRFVDNNQNNNIFGDEGEFHSDNSDDYSTLGVAIANNTHLKRLAVSLSDDLPLGVTNRGFYEGLHRNSSIHQLTLYCGNRNIAGGVGQEILKAYQKNGYLTVLGIYDADLQSGGDSAIGNTLRTCRNLQKLTLYDCNITDEQLLPMVESVRGHCLLEELSLNGNNIGNTGCDTIAILLADPNCNLRHLSLSNNAIDNEVATTIANSLTNNTKLRALRLHMNPINQSVQGLLQSTMQRNKYK